MIELSCSSCGKRYKLEDQMAGKRAKCKCGNVLLVPAASAAAPAAEPAQKPAPKPPATPPQRPAAVAVEVAAPEAAPATAECPSCGAAMGPSAVLCIECGYDKRTGKRLSGL